MADFLPLTLDPPARTVPVSRYTVERRFRFAAAHHLPGDAGKCAQVHGHNFDLWLSFSATAKHVESTGMVVHTETIKAVVEPLIDELDHSNLNALVENPTMENTARYIWDRLSGSGLLVTRLVLCETENQRVVLEGVWR